MKSSKWKWVIFVWLSGKKFPSSESFLSWIQIVSIRRLVEQQKLKILMHFWLLRLYICDYMCSCSITVKSRRTFVILGRMFQKRGYQNLLFMSLCCHYINHFGIKFTHRMLAQPHYQSHIPHKITVAFQNAWLNIQMKLLYDGNDLNGLRTSCLIVRVSFWWWLLHCCI